MLYGYAGRILRVNLSTGVISKEPTCPEMARKFLGGHGFAVYILSKELKRGVDPLGPENKLILASGPISGTLTPCSGKFTVGAKSPATGLIGTSNVGGHIGPELKLAGYDAVIVEGRAPYPVYLYIEDEKVEVRPAFKYWGKECSEVERELKEDLGEEFQCLVIGPAGENLVKFSCVRHDFGREAGRTGMGAVFGSKNLKAVAVRGTRTVPVYDKKRCMELSREMYAKVKANELFPEFSKYGTSMVTNWTNEVGVFPTKNFSRGYFESYKEINGDALVSRILVHNKGCFACPMGCGKYSRFEFKGKTSYVEGPEYETIALCGGNVMLSSIEDVARANYILDNLGLDTISGGNVIAFAVECFEKGLITRHDTGGFELRWGDIETVEWLARKIAYREGIGALLAEGVKKAAEVLGGDSEKFAMHVKGLEISGYDSHWAPCMALAYATCDIGAHHNRAWAITYDIQTDRDAYGEDKAERVIFLQHARPMFDMLSNCRLSWVETGLDPRYFAEFMTALTGVPYTYEELLKCAERAWNLTRLFGIKELGLSRKDDYPPERWFTPQEEVPGNVASGKHLDRAKYDQLLSTYYRKRGWDENGRPTPEKLRELGLEEFIE